MAAFTGFITEEVIIRHAHMACGIGGGAKGFNRAAPVVGNTRAKFVCVGGIDNDAGALREFERETGARGTLMDLFDVEQYVDFHDALPPPDFREATPEDVRRAYGDIVDVLFASMPCKGFSGLLSQGKSETKKYQALNRLTLRGLWLALEAYKDNPISVILFENVPRIRTRGRWLLDQIIALLRSYGYQVTESEHDCGELGNLAQSRNRFLLIARHVAKVPPFIYQPLKQRLRGVGEVIGKLPLPNDPVAGIMHNVPRLQWKTWVRLAFVPAGKDWRALNDLRVEDGVLADYAIVPEKPLRDGQLGVMRWSDTAGVLVGNQRSPLHGRNSVADPRPLRDAGMRHDYLGVNLWGGSSCAVSGRGGPTNGAYSVADPRPGFAPTTHQNIYSVIAYEGNAKTVSGATHVAGGALCVADPKPGYGEATHRHVLGVNGWRDAAGTISGSPKPTAGSFAIADIRVHNGHPKSVQLGVRSWSLTAPCVKGDMSVGGGPYAIADIRMGGPARFNNTYRIVPYSEKAPAVAGPGGPAGGLCVADPRPGSSEYSSRKYKVTEYAGSSRAVIGASTTGDGAFAVADPRCTWGPNSHRNKMRVTGYDGTAGSVIGADRVGSGAPSVADARREHYQTCGHYGVVPWVDYSGTVSASISHDNGPGNVADPRDVSIEGERLGLPEPKERLVCRIISTDGTWHRPFTTLELAALQSLIIPEEVFDYDAHAGEWRVLEDFELGGTSDSTRREWIGNMVPPKSAQSIAEEIGETLLLARMGETFQLSSKEIWVSPVRAAMAIDQDQPAFEMDI